MRFKRLLIGSLVLILIGCDNTKPTENTELIMKQSALTLQNLAILKSTYEGETSQENGQNLQKHVAKQVKWIEAAGFPLAGTYVGFPEIAENVFKPLSQDWINYRFTVEDYVANGNKVVAYGTYTGVYRATSKPFTARVAHVWHLEQGEITSFEQFVDSVPVVAAMK